MYWRVQNKPRRKSDQKFSEVTTVLAFCKKIFSEDKVIVLENHGLFSLLFSLLYLNDLLKF